jgi:ClpP class serine protease
MATQIPEFKVQNILIGFGIIVLIVGGVIYLRSKSTKEVKPSPSPEEIIVQQQQTVKKTGETTQPLTEEEIKQIREEVDSVLAKSGQSVALADVAGGQASGEAKRAFSNEKFYYKLTASGLKLVDKGFYYEGWLEKDSNSLSVGRLELDATGNGVLYYTASQDRSDYNRTLITLEPEDDNPEPAAPILEGNF